MKLIEGNLVAPPSLAFHFHTYFPANLSSSTRFHTLPRGRREVKTGLLHPRLAFPTAADGVMALFPVPTAAKSMRGSTQLLCRLGRRQAPFSMGSE